MITVDRRTRPDTAAEPLDADAFVDDRLAGLLLANGDRAGRAAARSGLVPLTLDVDGAPVTFAAGRTGLRVDRAWTDGLVLRLDRDAFSDLVSDVASIFGIQMTGRAEVVAGDAEALLDWEPVLRCLLDGRPVYQPGTIGFADRDGAPLDLQRSFTLDDDPDEIGHFLSEAGFLHLAGVFDEVEMAAVSVDLDEAIAAARPDDGASWWARTEQGERYPARILGFDHRSPALCDLLRDRRFGSIGTFTDDSFVQRDPDRSDAAEGLLKKIGVVEGISDVGWHKDCSMGGHSRRCCGLVVGISVSGAGRENGELGVVAGSHRANVPVLGVEGLDLPRRALPTRPGDITVHCTCTLHMSRPPVSAERRVVYTGFALAPRPGDPTVASASSRRDRAVLNDHVRRHQADAGAQRRGASFEL